LLEAAFLPLSDAGITLDRLLLYRAIVASGAETRWIGLLDRQARLVHVRDVLEDRLALVTGGYDALFKRRVLAAAAAYSKNLTRGRNRLSESAALSKMGPALEGVSPDDARLRVLSAILERFRAADIPTLVWVPPVNIEHLGSLGLSSDGLSRSARSIGAAAKAHGASFSNLHAILGDDAFVDSGDHVTADGSSDGARVIGDRLALEITKMLRRSRSASITNDPASHAVQ
jgi:hypothetical protein